MTPLGNWYFLDRAEPSCLGTRVLACGHIRYPGVARPLLQRRALDSYCLIYLVQGRGYFESRSCARRPIAAGDSLLMFPGEWHSYGVAEAATDWREFWFIFDGDTVRRSHEAGEFSVERPVAPFSDFEKTVPMLQQCMALAAEGAAASLRRLPGLVLALLSALVTPVRREQDPLSRIIALITDHPERPYDLPALARSHGMSYSHFRQRFALRTGLPPHRYLTRERMHRAAQRLALGATVKETCHAIGMSDPYYFSRVFKKTMGRSPRPFARSMQLWRDQRAS